MEILGGAYLVSVTPIYDEDEEHDESHLKRNQICERRGKPEIRIYSEERLGCVKIFHQIKEIREVSSG